MPFLKQESPLESAKIRVVALSGSLREDSLTTSSLRIALLGSAEAGADT